MSNYDAWLNSGNPLDDPEDPFDVWVDIDEFYEDELDNDEKDEVDAIAKEEGEDARIEKLRELWHEKHDGDGEPDEPDEPTYEEEWGGFDPCKNYPDEPYYNRSNW